GGLPAASPSSRRNLRKARTRPPDQSWGGSTNAFARSFTSEDARRSHDPLASARPVTGVGSARSASIDRGSPSRSSNDNAGSAVSYRLGDSPSGSVAGTKPNRSVVPASHASPISSSRSDGAPCNPVASNPTASTPAARNSATGGRRSSQCTTTGASVISRTLPTTLLTSSRASGSGTDGTVPYPD